jgi:phospholipase/lecithinase/hemolysin
MASNHCYYMVLLLIQFLMLSIKVSAKIPAVIVFGDSSVDAGNNNYIPTIARSNFEPYGRDFVGRRATGRFCNGRISTDFISEGLKIKPFIPAYLDPAYTISDFATGVTFASAGTGYDNATSDVLSVIPSWKEIEYYKDYQKKLRAHLGESAAKELITESLHMISMGTNDFLENYYTMPGRRSQYTISQYQDFLIGIAGNFVKELYGLGARKISLGGLPPMGCLPLERAENVMNQYECVETYNDLALEFNAKSKNLVMKLSSELPGVKLVFTDPYYIFLSIIQKPSLYGFEVASMACCATGTFEMGYICAQDSPFTCQDASKYVFWDAFHPTEKTNHIIADHIVKNVLTRFLD